MTRLRVSWSGNELSGMFLVHDQSLATPQELDELARLFAAAPDLLAALEAVKDAHAHIETANMPEWLDMVEDALAKAKEG